MGIIMVTKIGAVLVALFYMRVSCLPVDSNEGLNYLPGELISEWLQESQLQNNEIDHMSYLNADNEETPNENNEIEENHETGHIEIDDMNNQGIHNEDIIDLTHIKDSLYGKPDLTTGQLLSEWIPENGTNPEEIGSYFEGDMLIPRSKPRNGMLLHVLRWSNAIVPYEIRGRFNVHELATIQRGINAYHANTCIRFKIRTTEKDYISIGNENSGCWSAVGKIGGKQLMNLQSPNCLTKDGTFIHEMMHAIGFVHEHTRHERDSFINIYWDNIQPGMKNNFDKASELTTHAFGISYDYGSVMHYSSFAFSKNGGPTISPKQAIERTSMGQRDGFSTGDILKIKAMYGC